MEELRKQQIQRPWKGGTALRAKGMVVSRNRKNVMCLEWSERGVVGGEPS